jgi:hypothetical protein
MASARALLRQFPPDRPADAEKALNFSLEQLARDDQPIPEKAVWSARAEVDPHDDVRELMRQKSKRRAGIVADREYSLELADAYREAVARWKKLLEDIGLDDGGARPAPYVAPFLVRLAARPEEAPTIVQELAGHREERDSELFDTVKTAIEGTGKVNLMEYELAMDSALRRLMHWAGLALPGDAGHDAIGNGNGSR